MAAGEELLEIDIGDGAGGGDFEVAADKLCADGRSGDDAGEGSGGGFGVWIGFGGSAHAASRDHLQAGAGQMLLPEANRFGTESAHHQRGFHGVEAFLTQHLKILIPVP